MKFFKLNAKGPKVGRRKTGTDLQKRASLRRLGRFSLAVSGLSLLGLSACAPDSTMEKFAEGASFVVLSPEGRIISSLNLLCFEEEDFKKAVAASLKEVGAEKTLGVLFTQLKVYCNKLQVYIDRESGDQTAAISRAIQELAKDPKNTEVILAHLESGLKTTIGKTEKSQISVRVYVRGLMDILNTLPITPKEKLEFALTIFDKKLGYSTDAIKVVVSVLPDLLGGTLDTEYFWDLKQSFQNSSTEVKLAILSIIGEFEPNGAPEYFFISTLQSLPEVEVFEAAVKELESHLNLWGWSRKNSSRCSVKALLDGLIDHHDAISDFYWREHLPALVSFIAKKGPCSTDQMIHLMRTGRSLRLKKQAAAALFVNTDKWPSLKEMPAEKREKLIAECTSIISQGEPLMGFGKPTF